MKDYSQITEFAKNFKDVSDTTQATTLTIADLRDAIKEIENMAGTFPSSTTWTGDSTIWTGSGGTSGVGTWKIELGEPPPAPPPIPCDICGEPTERTLGMIFSTTEICVTCKMAVLHVKEKMFLEDIKQLVEDKNDPVNIVQ